MKRPCLGDCGRLVTGGGRCPDCRRTAERRRGTPTQRGYGRAHQAARQSLKSQLPGPCGYCGGWLTAEGDWVAAHVVDGDPSAGWLAAHRACNERAKGGSALPSRWGVGS